MKILALIALLFGLYCLIQVIAKWQYRNVIEKTIWFAIIAGIGWWSIATLMR